MTPIRIAAANSLVQLKIEDETILRQVLSDPDRHLCNLDGEVRQHTLVCVPRATGRAARPGYRWVPIRERQKAPQSGDL